jgi:hypothetical protein
LYGENNNVRGRLSLSGRQNYHLPNILQGL